MAEAVTVPTSTRPAECFTRDRGAARGLPRLVCLPHAGGSASGYRRWAGGLAGAVEVWGLDLRGRHSRAGEPMARTAPEVVDDIAGIVEALTDRPTFLFGHSMGGWIAYETTLALEERGISVAGLVVSGTPSPRDLAGRETVTSVDDDDLLARCVTWGGVPEDLMATDEFRRTALPGIRADVIMAQSYRPGTVGSHGRTVRAPLLALAGRGDDIVPSAQMAGWAKAGADWQGLTILPGEHFFTVTSETLVLSLLREFCRRVSPPSVAQRDHSSSADQRQPQ